MILKKTTGSVYQQQAVDMATQEQATKEKKKPSTRQLGRWAWKGDSHFRGTYCCSQKDSNSQREKEIVGVGK